MGLVLGLRVLGLVFWCFCRFDGWVWETCLNFRFGVGLVQYKFLGVGFGFGVLVGFWVCDLVCGWCLSVCLRGVCVVF